jgi:hypothetical protein
MPELLLAKLERSKEKACSSLNFVAKNTELYLLPYVSPTTNFPELSHSPVEQGKTGSASHERYGRGLLGSFLVHKKTLSCKRGFNSWQKMELKKLTSHALAILEHGQRYR